MKRFVRRTFNWLMWFGLVSVANVQATERPAFDEAAIDYFEKEVRPILVARCFECHSGSNGTPKGGLRLDSREAILRGGDTGPGVTLEKPATSLVVSAINYSDIYQMPPKSKLPAGEIAILTKWVESGLPWPRENSSSVGTVKPFDLTARAAEHWCWRPVTDHRPPEVKQKEWPISTIDQFILAKLESQGLSPAPLADKRALLRRVYFDLIGLPPSPDEIEQFAQDQGERAFESVVDKLLGSVHFGERWGRHWLDLTRYAETRGHEFEPIIPNAWQYRDYVIRALNNDVPYDQFLTEHIAGDLVEPRWRIATDQSSPQALPINEAVLGTGFWFLGSEVHSPNDIRRDETDRMENRVDVLSKTFLGLTVSCARCHDHKFDAISQRDFYALAGFAISGGYRQICVDTYEQHRQIAIQLAEVRHRKLQQTASKILDSARPVLDKLDRYLLVAMSAIDQRAVAAGAENTVPSPPPQIIDRLAAENNLDPKLLTSWCIELNSARNDRLHPLHGLFDKADLERSNDVGKKTDAAGVVVSTNPVEAYQGLVVDFGDPKTVPLIQDGVSFGLRPVERGRLVIEGPIDAPSLHVATIGGWQRDLFWNDLKLAPRAEVDPGTLGSWQRSGRMVRSPEFTLTNQKVWYLVRGSVRAYATVNSHLIVMGPRHSQLLREFKHDDDKWHWVSHGLEQYEGHRLHVEFSPIDGLPCSIAMIVQCEQQPKLPAPNWSWLQEFASSGQTETQRTDSYKKAIVEAANSITERAPHASNGKSDSIDRNVFPPDSRTAIIENDSQQKFSKAGQAYLADWFVSHLRLFSHDQIELTCADEASLAKQVQWESSLAPAMLEGNGVDEFLLVRGNSDAPKHPVSRGFLEAFHQAKGKSSPDEKPTSNTGFGSGRLELAQEILRSPLASRVMVNRIWHHLFGRGIVPSVDNLGALGLPPSHPELLDHLATQFVKDGWSTKRMIRSLVLSRTYQMSSHPTDADSHDPDNGLWHRMLIKRLEGEVIRDALLTVSGTLNRTPYGPAIPIHLTQFMQGRGRPGSSGPLDGNGRRSIYISVRRNFLSPMMLAFDTPSPSSTVGRRTVSNVPAQALILMNDPFVIDQANRWADRILSEPTQSTEQRLDRLYLTAFARHPTPAETTEAIAFLNSLNLNPAENQREAWSNLCHVIFNVKEFVYID